MGIPHFSDGRFNYDKDDKPIKSLKVDSRDYIIVPSGATVELAP